MESVLKPKKRIFVSLTLASAFLGAVFIYLCWRVALPGLVQISSTLPVLFGSVWHCGCNSTFGSCQRHCACNFRLSDQSKHFIFGPGKPLIMLFPFAVGLGRIFNIPRQRIEQSFIEVSNHLVRQHKIKVPASRIMILTPHCIQLDTCAHKNYAQYRKLPSVRTLLCRRNAWAGT